MSQAQEVRLQMLEAEVVRLRETVERLLTQMNAANLAQRPILAAKPVEKKAS